MGAGSVVTLGIGTERGAVHAVALSESGDTLGDRLVLRRAVPAGGDGRADLAAAVESVLDTMAAELEPEYEIAGTAVTYRDAAERRALVTRLATTRWNTASLVSARSAHLYVAGAMTWLDEFENLLVCESVAGHQAVTLVDGGRRRVLAAHAQPGAPTPGSLHAAVSAAMDQIEAAAVRPDAVVLVGSAADAPALREAVGAFGVPVIPCRIAAFAPAAGAALVALEDVAEVPSVASRGARRGTVLLAAAASVLAGGLVTGGALMIDGGAQVEKTAVSTDAEHQPGAHPDQRRPAAATIAPPVQEAADSGSGAGGLGSGSALDVHPGQPFTDLSPNPQQVDPGQFPLQYPTELYSGAPGEGEPLPLEPAAPGVQQAPASVPFMPGSGVPTRLVPNETD
ncbi:hypothetical protein ACWEVD_00330 [Nocardia thailandica]